MLGAARVGELAAPLRTAVAEADAPRERVGAARHHEHARRLEAAPQRLGLLGRRRRGRRGDRRRARRARRLRRRHLRLRRRRLVVDRRRLGAGRRLRRRRCRRRLHRRRLLVTQRARRPRRLRRRPRRRLLRHRRRRLRHRRGRLGRRAHRRGECVLRRGDGGAGLAGERDRQHRVPDAARRRRGVRLPQRPVERAEQRLAVRVLGVRQRAQRELVGVHADARPQHDALGERHAARRRREAAQHLRLRRRQHDELEAVGPRDVGRQRQRRWLCRRCRRRLGGGGLGGLEARATRGGGGGRRNGRGCGREASDAAEHRNFLAAVAVRSATRTRRGERVSSHSHLSVTRARRPPRAPGR